MTLRFQSHSLKPWVCGVFEALAFVLCVAFNVHLSTVQCRSPFQVRLVYQTSYQTVNVE